MSFFRYTPNQIKWMMRLWPPLWFTGIRFEYISDDFRHVTTSMSYRFYNKNFHGFQYGGNLFSMTDPCLIMMLLRNMGSHYRVLDKAGTIDFIKPGLSAVTADFLITEADIQDILEHTKNGEKYFKDFHIDIKDANEVVIAKVIRTLYIRKKQKLTQS